ncbi:MAG: VWA domain-containing protein [Sedimenticolaceae bacterium]
MGFEFAWPWMFAALFLPLLTAGLLPRARTTPEATLRFPFLAVLQQGTGSPVPRRSRLRLILAALTWLLLVVAASRPQWIGETISLPVTGRSLMLAVDISGSMETEDMVINGRPVMRLSAVKMVAGEFVEKREGDRLGLILFGDQAYLQTPLTFDRRTLHILLNEAAIGLAGKSTAIGDAIGLAVKRLRGQPEKNRVLILLTDGANTSGSVDPLKAADLAASEGVRIYTIGVGADDMMPGPFRMLLGAGRELDEASLQAIAQKTGGRYFRARDTRSLQQIYALLDEIEPVSEDEQSYRPVEELYAWPLALALLLSLLTALAGAHAWRPGPAAREN